MAQLYMSDISALYDIEDEATEAHMGREERVLLRRKKARPVLAQMLRRTRGWKELYSTSGKMGEAIKYMLNQWTHLKCFLRDGLVPLDNNDSYAARGITGAMPRAGLCRAETGRRALASVSRPMEGYTDAA